MYHSFIVLSSLYAVPPASQRFARVAHCQCGAFVVVCRVAGFTTSPHKSNIAQFHDSLVLWPVVGGDASVQL